MDYIEKLELQTEEVKEVETLEKHSIINSGSVNKYNGHTRDFLALDGDYNDGFKQLKETDGIGISCIVSKEVKEARKDVNGNVHARLKDRLDSDVNSIGVISAKYFGAKGDGINDDSDAILVAMEECASQGKILSLDGTYYINKPIVYMGWTGLTILGSKGNVNTLIPTETVTSNLKFGPNGSLEINKMGSVSFYGVGFTGVGKGVGNALLKIKSFHNKVFNCSFSNANIGILIENGTNWTGENQILYSGFHNLDYAYKSNAGSDSDFIGNLINGHCSWGFYGLCAGHKITNNHFYSKMGCHFEIFNTNISHNYFQETSGENELLPTVTLSGSFGLNFNNNNFELVNDEPRSDKKALIGIKSRSGGGNLSFIGNTVHGKSPKTVVNLALFEMLPAENGTTYDMPIIYNGNSTRCLSAIFKTNYPKYNIKGTLSYKNVGISVLTGTLDESVSKTEVINGIAHVYAKINGPFDYSGFARINDMEDIPVVVNMFQTKKSGTETRTLLCNTRNINMSNYSEVVTVELRFMYPIAHSGEVPYFLP